MTEYVELPVSAADRERFRRIAEQTAVSLEARRDGFHVITERADGPDLDDLVRLIRYLREHGITPTMSSPGDRLFVVWPTSDAQPTHYVGNVHEGVLCEGYFVGPDGTVYDANREAL